VLKGHNGRTIKRRYGMIITTFSSHIERIQAICNIADESNRKILLLGRSMERYCTMAETMGLLKLPDTASVYGSPKAVNRALQELMKTDRNMF